MARHGELALMLGVALACVACPAGPKDPPPPEEGTALASAAPRALGARAGGTDAAPPAVFAPSHAPDELEGVPLPEVEVDAGVEPDAAGAGGDELPL